LLQDEEKAFMMKTSLVNHCSLSLLILFFISCGLEIAQAAMGFKESPAPSDLNSFVQKAGEGDTQAVLSALKKGMAPDAQNNNGETALIAAVKQGKKEIVDLLLAKGADVNGRDSKFGGTPLIWAALNGKTEIVGLLLEKGADLKGREKYNGLSAIHSAAVKGNDETVRFLLDKGAPVDARDNEARTPLMWAANSGKVETVKLLLDSGANLEAAEAERGMNALMSAAMMGRTGTVQLLLDRGANIEKTDHDGRTPLMWAAQYVRLETVKLLLKRGADVKVRDKKGNSVLALVKSSKSKKGAKKEVETLLMKAMPDTAKRTEL